MNIDQVADLFETIFGVCFGCLIILFSIVIFRNKLNSNKGWKETKARITGKTNCFYPAIKSKYHIQRMDKEYQIEYVVNNVKYTKYLTNIGHLNKGNSIRILYYEKRPSRFKEVERVTIDDEKLGFSNIVELICGVILGCLILYLTYSC